MNRQALLDALHANPFGGWTSLRRPALPAVQDGSRLLWCGIGGSLLPSETLVRAFQEPFQGAWVPLASPEPSDVELHDSDQLVFASKSGKTLELWTWLSRLRATPAWRKLQNAPIVISQDDENPLARFARAEGWPILPIPVNVGGRYSAFTPIGTLPLAWMGQDTDAFLEGGRQAGEAVTGQGLWHDRIWGMVETLHQAWLDGVTEWVLIPYCERLETLTAWWVQLVAESLGKEAKDGARRGFTPIRSVGPVDQHSQLQRWMAGPRNLGVIMLTVDGVTKAERLDVPEGCPYPNLARLSGSEVVAAQAEGTREALQGQGVPVVHWALDRADEAELGRFMMAWQYIVGLTGISLEVDPFDQPAVEDGKIRTFRKLGLI